MARNQLTRSFIAEWRTSIVAVSGIGASDGVNGFQLNASPEAIIQGVRIIWVKLVSSIILVDAVTVRLLDSLNFCLKQRPPYFAFHCKTHKFQSNHGFVSNWNADSVGLHRCVFALQVHANSRSCCVSCWQKQIISIRIELINQHENGQPEPASRSKGTIVGFRTLRIELETASIRRIEVSREVRGRAFNSVEGANLDYVVESVHSLIFLGGTQLIH